MLNANRLKSTIFTFYFIIKFIFPIVNSVEVQAAQPQQQRQPPSVAPILDIEDESIGYIGTIGERNVLVDLKPHLQIKNIDAINGICSYHVFKPNSEEFPFTIDIKDKSTGEAVIEVIRKEVEQTTQSVDSKSSKPLTASNNNNLKSVILDCNKRKEFNFLIQAHDCSTPSLASNKIPVKIEVIDHDDYVLQFDQSEVYKKTLVESDEVYANFMSIKARDNDCTNDGYACSYQILSSDDVNNILAENNKQIPFKLDNNGMISSLRALKHGELFEFKVRAFDCLNKESYVDAQVHIDVIEACYPQWTDYPNEILSTLETTNLFEQLKSTQCEQLKDVEAKSDSVCQIDNVSAKVTLHLDPSIKNICETKKCTKSVLPEIKIEPEIVQPVTTATTTQSRLVLFSGAGKSDYEDDDSIEDEDTADDQNKILPKPEETNSKESRQPPLNYRSFSKAIENAQKVEFDGKFSNEFTLSAWLRRPANADKSIKEQVFCGTDSQSMNRHHYGLYFYRGNLKFLMRKEPNTDDQTAKTSNAKTGDATSSDENNEVFYPSLWEWSLYEPVIGDNKWHYYEIKFNYPNATLYIDGVKFIENTTNSDIIDAYELNEINGVGEIISYVGACYHARTKSLIDHFEGDIGNIVLVKKQVQSTETTPAAVTTTTTTPPQLENTDDCTTLCHESIQINLVGNENYLHSIENSNQNEISIQTSNLNDMSQIIRKITYANKDIYPQTAPRSIQLSTTIQCSNNGKQINLKELNINLNVKRQKQEFNVQLDGSKQLFAVKNELENGIEPFKEISIQKIAINKLDDSTNTFESDKNNEDSSENSEENNNDSAQQTDSSRDQSQNVKLSKCQIRVVPERNLMAPTQNNEKIMFLQNLLDEFGFDFKETADLVTITGIQNVENYEKFIRRLTYVITNINEIPAANVFKTKQFYLSCLRNEPNIETNTILVQINVTRNEKMEDSKNTVGFVAHKQMQKFVVSENEDDIIQKKTDDFIMSQNSNEMSSPLVVALIVMCSCAIGFLLVFGAIKLHNAGYFGGKRKTLPNEENPQMEWDDSGLNITENPLETLENNKECGQNSNQHVQTEYEGDEYSTSDEEEEEDEDEDSNEEDDQYSSEEEPEKVIDRELEWDDTSIELKIKEKNSTKNLSNKTTNLASDLIDKNKFL